MDIVVGGGADSLNNKNLLSSIPLTAPALNVVAYTGSGVKDPIVSVPSEIYSISVRFLDDNGIDYTQSSAYNSEIAIAVFY